jgi:hypothetical protein
VWRPRPHDGPSPWRAAEGVRRGRRHTRVGCAAVGAVVGRWAGQVW